MPNEFANEPLTDFTDSDQEKAYREAIADHRGQLDQHMKLVIGGEEVETAEEIRSINPCAPNEVIGTSAAAEPRHAEAALEAGWQAFGEWSRLDAHDRAAYVLRLAGVLRTYKHHFSSLMTLEAGKNWIEADADTAEAIDFCEYYASQAIDLAQPYQPTDTDTSFLIPIGAGVAIPPWNFPLAILTGLTIGPVAAGNTVVLKPASNTPLIAGAFMDAVQEAGFPPGVVNLVPGGGAVIGDTLVDHPSTRFVNFTGSKEVGLRISERAAKVHAGQRWLKRAYMEMGGKDAIVVDETADLDAAATGVVTSAFGFQGQKCSACSRLIVVEEVQDELLDRVVEKAAALEVGPAEDNYAVNAVISKTQYDAIWSEIEKGKEQADLVIGGRRPWDAGYYIEPTIFAGVDPDSRLAQHEIFGPVLSVISARDFDNALEIANGTEYALTGGIFSEDGDRIERARRDFHVGNLYVNRKITGALVWRQPFGGFNMSGSNAKAGGPDYLRLFMEMKTVGEA
ncbi:MAG: L-glutamate gamma-semialdehyde dehydrogenase, partial [Acidimicrobiia bacterium]